MTEEQKQLTEQICNLLTLWFVQDQRGDTARAQATLMKLDKIVPHDDPYRVETRWWINQKLLGLSGHPFQMSLFGHED